MYRYRNANTGDEVDYPARSRRLDALPNWTLVAEPPPQEPVVTDPDPGDESPPNPEGNTPDPESGDQTTQGGVGAEGADGPAEIPSPPARSASKAVWVDFAVRMGADRSIAEAMSKDLLWTTYGHLQQ